MGIPNNIQDAHASHSILISIWCQSSLSLRATNSITSNCYQEGLTNEENVRLRLEELEALDEKRLEAQQHLECYQARLSRAFNKRV